MCKVPELSTIDASAIHTGDLFKSSYLGFGSNLVSTASGGNDQTGKGFGLAEKKDWYGIYVYLIDSYKSLPSREITKQLSWKVFSEAIRNNVGNMNEMERAI